MIAASRPGRSGPPLFVVATPLDDRGALHQEVEDAVIQGVQSLAKGRQAILEGKDRMVRAGSGFGRTRHRWLTGRLQDHD